MGFVGVYDNSRWGTTPWVLWQAERGEIVYLADQLPEWLTTTLL